MVPHGVATAEYCAQSSPRTPPQSESDPDEFLARELVLEIISMGVLMWDKESCISAALVSHWWKRHVQQFRCRTQSVVLFPEACWFPTDRRDAHKWVVCHHGCGLYQFWASNSELARHVSRLNVVYLEFVEDNAHDTTSKSLHQLFPNVNSIFLTGHFTTSFIHQIGRRLTELIIGSCTIFSRSDMLLELFCSAPLLRTFQIHLVANSSKPFWTSTKKCAEASIVTRLSRLSVIIEDVALSLPHALATGKFLDWLSGDAGAATQTVKVCFIEAPCKLGHIIDRFLRHMALVEVGISLKMDVEEAQTYTRGQLRGKFERSSTTYTMISDLT